jgi:uncharacterized protein YcbK (DUF882 family)
MARLWTLVVSLVFALAIGAGPAAARGQSKPKRKTTRPAAHATQPKRTVPVGSMTLYSLNTRDKVTALKVMDVTKGKKGKKIEKLRPAAVRRVTKLLRDYRTGGTRRVPERLLTQLYLVQQSFDAPIDVVSGYRHNARKTSRHFRGYAVDFRVKGVPVKRVWETCKRFKNTGCGYYPNSSFVHVDVRDPGAGHVSWIDASGPGRLSRPEPFPAPASASRSHSCGHGSGGSRRGRRHGWGSPPIRRCAG